jgi:hypothetical protein
VDSITKTHQSMSWLKPLLPTHSATPWSKPLHATSGFWADLPASSLPSHFAMSFPNSIPSCKQIKWAPPHGFPSHLTPNQDLKKPPGPTRGNSPNLV